MRLLYISSGEGWPFCWVDEAIAHAIKEAKVDAQMLNANAFAKHADMMGYIEAHKPKAILTMNSTSVHMNFFTHLRSKGYKTALWCTDDPYDSDSSIGRGKLFDWVITDEVGCTESYRSATGHKAFYVPLGADTSTFRPITVAPSYQSDICIVGTGFDVRLKAVDYMANYLNSKNTIIIGHRWERLSSYPRLKHRIRDVVPPKEVVNYYNGAQIIINIHREYNCKYLNRNSRGLKAYSPNNRVFDIAACGAFQIISVRRDIDKYLKNGKECVIAKDSNEIINYCEYYLKNPQARKQMTDSAYTKVMGEHKMSDRIKKIIGYLGV